MQRRHSFGSLAQTIHSEKASGAKADRTELTRVLRRGDVLVVWKLDRLARSLKKLITTAEDLEERGIGLISLTQGYVSTFANEHSRRA